MNRQMSAERLSELIGAVYDCAIAPERWGAAIDGIRHQFGFANAMMSVSTLPTQRAVFHAAAEVDASDLARAAEYGPEIVALWGGRARLQRLPLGEPAILTRASDPALWKRNRYYREWAEPQGLLDAVTLPVARDATRIGRISFARHRSVGPVDGDSIAGLRLLAPHICRAVAIGNLLDMKAVETAALTSALDALAIGVVLIDQHAAVVHANAAACEMLSAEDPILSRRRRLGLRDRAAQAPLEVALLAAAPGGTGMVSQATAVPVRRVSGAPCIVYVLPLGQARFGPAPMQQAAAAIFVVPAVRPLRSSIGALAALYDLTPAEMRVFELICEGKGPADIAPALGIAMSTTKTHLIHIFGKTGCRRQADLVQLAASVALPLSSRDLPTGDDVLRPGR